ncbi:hypothetical protein LTR37_017876 [Vermiconidia calcicola]|uniref:Uncharacterized protein n=1 Tax=Vermiconidia calcicola TaxID=1690605 RepID=A0ACC3MJU6_9PEZI|nr:hypothetical protein LTR37_017876 [Vermiconidia calcicola]
MVNIAIAGGGSNVASEVIDVLCAAQKHDILLLSRKDAPKEESRAGVRWAKTNYQDIDELVKLLDGVHTLLSFTNFQPDSGAISQRNLVDASIRAGVMRFAPSEWALLHLEHTPWYAGKIETRKYLEQVNKDKKTLEYCIFVPGLFTNYFTYPYPSADRLSLFELHIDFNNRRALGVEGDEDARITLTTVQDFANIVGKSVEYEGEWPVIGGIKGTELSVAELLAIGEKVRGGQFKTERLKAEDLKAGKVNGSWLPTVGHHSVSPEQWKAFAAVMNAGMLQATAAGALNVSDEWNRLLPDYKCTQAGDFLAESWRGKS